VLITRHFSAKLELTGDDVFEIERGDAARSFLSSLAEYDPEDEDFIIESSQAFGRIKTLLEANLSDLTYARIGPADEDGTMAIDAGAYPLVVLGRTVDGKVVGFFIVSVET
jgi:hypothetical protein